MKEVTVILTCEITDVAVVTNEDAVIVEKHSSHLGDYVAMHIKKDLKVDDAKILKKQVFIRDLPDQ